MQGLCYKNTATNIPNWEKSTHEAQHYGFAYELPDRFVHIYGRGTGLFTISPGLTVAEEKNDSLCNWVTSVFGAKDIKHIKNKVGYTVNGIWRPGLFYQNEIEQGLEIDPYEQHFSEQSLRILINALDQLLLYVEPHVNSLNAYGHKSRELLILACTEVESHWKSLLTKAEGGRRDKAALTTNDYVKLCSPAHLSEYKIRLRQHKTLPLITPFSKWTTDSPTKSLAWYDAYNKTKHDREQHFDQATLENVIHAVSACIILFCVRFGPYYLHNSLTALSSIFNQMFEISLNEPDITSFYIPLLQFPQDMRRDRFVFDPYQMKMNAPWQIKPLAL